MTLEKAKQELEKFVQLKTTLRPSFVDVLLNAEGVVRCKDCVYWLEDINHCRDQDKHANADDYCSWGERKNGASDN